MKKVEITASSEQWAEVTRRAGDVPVERFIVACAIKGNERAAEGQPLVLSPVEQRRLLVRVENLERAHRLLLSRLQGSDVTLHEALAFICKAAENER